MFVYLITNQINGKKYVGQTSKTIQQRWVVHYKDANKGKKFPIHEAIRKYNLEVFVVTKIAKVTCETKEEGIEWLNELEILFIKYHNSLVPNGYNLSEGGKNKVSHPITKAKISAAKLGKPSPRKGTQLSDETKYRISSSNKGRAAYNKGKPSPLKGIPRTEETKQRISDSNIGRVSGFFGKKHLQESKDKIGSKSKERGFSKKARENAIAANTGKKHTYEFRIQKKDAAINRPRDHKGQFVALQPPKSEQSDALIVFEKKIAPGVIVAQEEVL